MKRIIMLAAFLLMAGCFLFVSCGTADDQCLAVVPYPNEVEVRTGAFNASGADFHYSEEFDDAARNVIRNFARQLSLVSGKESAVDTDGASKGFVFIFDSALPDEAYRLDISRKAAVVRASSLRGVNYAVQTMKQMLPVEIFGKVEAADKDWSLVCAEISDAPHFGYRGFMLDVARHYFDMDAIKKYLDIMEVHKMNKFHWHLTDDQGWRIEIKKYPRLTEFGSIRRETLIGHPNFSNEYDGTPYGEGLWFSQDQVREIIAYAASKGIDVIPEIDLPGHMRSALASYPELGCTGGPYTVRTNWGVEDDVLCAGNEKVMEFLENVLSEVAELFPYEYIHIGGDECPKVRWESCPECQAKIRELGLEDGDGFSAEHYLQSYMVEKVARFLESRGKKVIGWDEILEGRIGKSATIMSWRGTAGGLKAAKLGNDVIMSPNIYSYLDRYQSSEMYAEPTAMGGYVPIERAYSFDPQEGMTDEEKSHVLGLQANMWTEYISDTEYLEFMLNPRLAAVSEVQWCEPDNRHWDRFVASAGNLCEIYDIMGYNYSTHIFGVRGSVGFSSRKQCPVMTLESHGTIRYTLDGSDPDMDSPVYEKPIEIRETCILKAKSERDGVLVDRLYSKSFEFHKAMSRSVQVSMQSEETRKYNSPYNYPDQLVDGYRSTTGGFWSGDYVGWYSTPFEIVIDMTGTTYSSVLLSTVLGERERIVPPENLVAYVSEDGNEYEEVARLEIPSFSSDDKDGCYEYSVSFPETSAKFLKVTARCRERMPEWHSRRGDSCFLYVDEVVVR